MEPSMKYHSGRVWIHCTLSRLSPVVFFASLVNFIFSKRRTFVARTNRPVPRRVEIRRATTTTTVVVLAKVSPDSFGGLFWKSRSETDDRQPSYRGQKCLRVSRTSWTIKYTVSKNTFHADPLRYEKPTRTRCHGTCTRGARGRLSSSPTARVPAIPVVRPRKKSHAA